MRGFRGEGRKKYGNFKAASCPQTTKAALGGRSPAENQIPVTSGATARVRVGERGCDLTQWLHGAAARKLPTSHAPWGWSQVYGSHFSLASPQMAQQVRAVPFLMAPKLTADQHMNLSVPI